MDFFAALTAFTTVVERGAFARAARELGQSTSSLTRQVDALEERLGTVLLNRSTRRLTLTDAGAAYHEQALRILADLEEANRGVAGGDGPPAGTLRVSLPVAFAQMHVSPLLPDFLRDHPAIRLELMLTDEPVDLVGQRVDVAIRIGALDASSLVARKLAPLRRIACASPAYLAARGLPEEPADLARHDCCCFAYGHGGRVWRFGRDGDERIVPVSGPVRANNSMLLRDAALAGMGVILMPSWLVGADIEAGRLTPLLPGWTADPGAGSGSGGGAGGGGIHALYLPSRKGSRTVRAFVDFLLARFGSPPHWDRSA